MRTATANQPAQSVVELEESSTGRPPCLIQQTVGARLELISQTASPSKTPLESTATVSVEPVSSSVYKVVYLAGCRGQYKLHIQVNGKDIDASPLAVTVYPDPSTLGHPVRVVTGLDKPYGVDFDSRGRMIVSEWGRDRISVLSNRGQKIQFFKDEVVYPAGIAVDDADNVFVSSSHKLLKFSGGGELIKSVDRGGQGAGGVCRPSRHYALPGSSVRL